jgi:hypothetical protein
LWWRDILVGSVFGEGFEAEGALEELPGADYVADPDGDGRFADVPELVGCCEGGGEVVVPVSR